MEIRLLLFFLIILIICQKGYMDNGLCQNPLPIENPGPFLKFYGFNVPRPSWFNDGTFNVQEEFKRVHFGGIDGTFPLDLCHVMDWRKIKVSVVQVLEDCFTQLWNDRSCNAGAFTDLQLFIELLFTIDKDAVVYDKVQPSNWESPYKKYDTDYLNSVLKINNQKLKIESMLIIQKLPNRLKEEIKMMRNDGTQAQDFIAYHNENASTVASLLSIVFSAPANLRYGHRYTNECTVRDSLDPMGTEFQTLTSQEKQWMKPSAKYGTKWCNNPKEFTEGNFKGYYSSNGKKEVLVLPAKKNIKCVLDINYIKRPLQCLAKDGG